MLGRVALTLLLLVWAGQSEAGETVLGWMNLDNCRTTEWTNDGIFGTPSPTYREAEQRAYLRLEYYDATGGRLFGEIKHCGERGVVAATLAGLIFNLSATAPTFYAVFGQCMGSLYDRVSSLNLKVDSECLWE